MTKRAPKQPPNPINMDIDVDEVRAILEENRNGPAITSKTSIHHHRTTVFSNNKEPK